MATAATFLTIGADKNTHITSDASWTSVLASEALEKSTEKIEANGDAELTIVSKGELGTLTFSSDKNKTAFSTALPSGRFKSQAWVGDTLGCENCAPSKLYAC